METNPEQQVDIEQEAPAPIDLGGEPAPAELDFHLSDVLDPNKPKIVPNKMESYAQQFNSLLGKTAFDGSELSEMQRSVKDMAMTAAQAGIKAGTLSPEMLDTVRQQYNDPAYADALQSLFVRLEGPIDFDAGQYAQRAGGLERIGNLMESFKAQYATERTALDRGQVRSDGTMDKAAAGVKVVADAVESVLAPTYYQTLANSIQAVFPELNWKDRTQMGTTMEAVGERIRKMESKEQAKVVTAIMEEIRQRSGDVFENKIVMGQMIDELQAAIMVDPKTATGWFDRWGRELVGNLGTVGDLIAVGGTVRALAKKAGILAPSIAKGTPADIANTTTRGQSRLNAAATSNDPVGNLAKLGTTPEQVMGTNALPKSALTGSEELTVPYLRDSYFQEGQIEQLTELRKSEVATELGVRTKDVVINIEDGIEKATIYYGQAGTGKGFTSEVAAKEFASKLDDPNAEVFRVGGGGWFIRQKQERALGYEDAARFRPNLEEVTTAPYQVSWLKGFFGKATNFGTEFTDPGNVAAAISATEKNQLAKILKPYTKLWGRKQREVQELTRLTEVQNKRFTRDDLYAMGHTDDDVLDGYQALVDHAERTTSIANLEAYMKARQAGWVSASVNKEEIFLEPANQINRKGYVYDLDSGNVIDATSVTKATHNVFRIVDPKDGVLTAISKKGSKAIKPLPTQIIGAKQGRLFTRQYSASHIVKVQDGVLPDGVTPIYRSIATAQSEGSAQRYVAALAAENPNNKYVYKLSSEIDEGVVESVQELRNLENQGLLATSRRLDEALPDVDGVYNLKSFDDMLNATTSSAANSAGLQRWIDFSINQWEKAYKDRFGSFNAFHKPSQLLSDEMEDYNQAYALWSYIAKTAGSHPSELSRAFQGFSGWLGNLFLEAARVTKPVGLLSNVLRFVGKEVSGVSSTTVSTLKTAGVVAWMLTNPARQWFMQTSMVFTYLGVKGGFKYAFSGKMAKEFWLISSAGTNPDELVKLGAKLGYTSDEVRTITTAWKQSGLADLASNHVFTMGTLGATAATGSKGGITKAAETIIRGGQRVGLDVAIGVDKKASWLVAMNEFREANGRLPRTQKEWDKITGKAERLSLSQNASDTSVPVSGAASLYFQFMSQQYKMAGRLLGLEKGLSAREKIGMATSSLVFFGAEGYAAGQLAGFLLNKMGFNETEHPDIALALREGINGTVMTMAFRALDDEDGKDTELAFSGTFSPTNGGIVGVTPDTIMKLFMGTLDISNKMNGGFLQDAPAFSLISGVSDAVKFASALVGVQHFQTEDKALMAASKFAQSFSGYNNAFKAYMGMNLMATVDGRGNPIVEAAKGELLAKGLIGVKSNDEVNYQRQLETMKGQYAKMDNTDLSKEININAQEYARKVLIPMLNMMGDKLTPAQIEENIEGHNALIAIGLNRAQAQIYFDVIRKEIEKSGLLKSDAFMDSVLQDIVGGRVVDGTRIREVIRLAPVSDERKQEAFRILDEATISGEALSKVYEEKQ